MSHPLRTVRRSIDGEEVMEMAKLIELLLQGVATFFAAIWAYWVAIETIASLGR